MFAGKRIQESGKSRKKTVAKEAEKNRRAELEKGFNAIEDNRTARIQTISEMAEAYLASYRLRNPRSATFAEFALGHIKRHIGGLMRVDVSERGSRRELSDRASKREGGAEVHQRGNRVPVARVG
jgi:hypothetical protein